MGAAICNAAHASLPPHACFHISCARVQSIEKKAPFSQYSRLRDVDVVYGDPKNPDTYPEGKFDIIYDNNGKKLEECQPLIDTYASQVRAATGRSSGACIL